MLVQRRTSLEELVEDLSLPKFCRSCARISATVMIPADVSPALAIALMVAFLDVAAVVPSFLARYAAAT